MEVIKVDNIYKSFKIYFDKGSSFKERILFRNRNRHEVHEVLKGVSLSIKKGEVVGLIGENGSGKSTLLKLMTKIIYPDKGSIKIKGKVSSLLELGAGFHPDMTGRENIYTNASIFGLTKKEIDDRLEQIIEFSELGEYIDNPVRTYSSGMYMRLAFSVAINVDAEILLIDEILAVGDASFQAKCFNKMQEIKKEGKTIVIVSHDTGAIERLCTRTIWIDSGLKKLEGSPRSILPKYLDKVMSKSIEESNNKNIDETKKNCNLEVNNKANSNENNNSNRTGNRFVEITEISMLSLNDKKEKYNYKVNESLQIKVEYTNKRNIDKSIIGFAIYRNDGIRCYGSNTFVDNGEMIKLNNEGNVYITFRELQLLSGEYTIDIAFHDENGIVYDYIREAKSFTVYNTKSEEGIVRLNHEFIIE